MYRVELKGRRPLPQKGVSPTGSFLMYRVELKGLSLSMLIAFSALFLMYRVELKAEPAVRYGREGSGS